MHDINFGSDMFCIEYLMKRLKQIINKYIDVYNKTIPKLKAIFSFVYHFKNSNIYFTLHCRSTAQPEKCPFGSGKPLEGRRSKIAPTAPQFVVIFSKVSGVISLDGNGSFSRTTQRCKTIRRHF